MKLFTFCLVAWFIPKIYTHTNRQIVLTTRVKTKRIKLSGIVQTIRIGKIPAKADTAIGCK